MMRGLVVVDPLTLVGRELLLLLPRFGAISAEVGYVHTASDDEHQIAELDGEPALVPPLDDPGMLEDCAAVVVASDTATPRLELLERFFDASPATPVIDASGLEPLARWGTVTAGRPQDRGGDSHLRVAHPALIGAVRVVDPIRHLEPVSLAVAAVEPVSSFGQHSIELLAEQASTRLRGVPVEREIEGHVLAFTAVALPSDRLCEEAAALVPFLETTATRTLAGNFHGHLAHLAIGFASAVDEDELREAWAADPSLRPSPLPMTLDAVPDNDLVLIAPPYRSPHGKLVAVTTMVDGLRVGGALTALELLGSLLAP